MAIPGATFIPESRVRIWYLLKKYVETRVSTHSITLDSGINVAPGITVAPPLKNFHIMILILFYTNLGIVIIFEFFLSSKIFKK